MAKKKSHPPKKAPKPRAKPDPDASVELPDRRAIEIMMRDMLGGLLEGPAAPDTPLGHAQVIVDAAFDETDPKKQAKLAKKALELSPDCADAYLLLAENAKTRKEALALYEQAVSAGERAIGPDAFRNDVGHFWGLLETRPYMRAREALAHTLWTSGRRDEAAAHLQDMLRLNPGDNQGVRYNLASWLLDLDRDEDLDKLLGHYDENSATWAYTRALFVFRRKGDTPEARKRLKAAQKVNPHVPAYLLGDEPMPSEQPAYYSPGEESEAVIYAAGGLSAWRATPGALTWLRDATKVKSKSKKSQGPKGVGPSATGKKRLMRLRQTFDTWQAECRPLGSLIEADGELVQPWIVLVISLSEELILAQTIAVERPSAAILWDTLVQAMHEPMMSEPHRPTQLEIRPDPAWDDLAGHLDDIGVECVRTADLPQINALLENLTEHLNGKQPPGLLEMPGVTPEKVAGFYHAAAEFYRKAPWKRLGYEEAIRVQTGRFESGPWYAVVMGQSGMTLGVALYEDLKLLRKMWTGNLSDEENARQTVALTVTFEPETQMPSSDLLAAREHGWEIATPEAYPVVFRKEKGLVMRPPLAWELELMEGCLRAIPGLVAKHEPDDTTPHEVTVPVASGELPLTLSWVAEE